MYRYTQKLKLLSKVLLTNEQMAGTKAVATPNPWIGAPHSEGKFNCVPACKKVHVHTHMQDLVHMYITNYNWLLHPSRKQQ